MKYSKLLTLLALFGSVKSQETTPVVDPPTPVVDPSVDPAPVYP